MNTFIIGAPAADPTSGDITRIYEVHAEDFDEATQLLSDFRKANEDGDTYGIIEAGKNKDAVTDVTSALGLTD